MRWWPNERPESLKERRFPNRRFSWSAVWKPPLLDLASPRVRHFRSQPVIQTRTVSRTGRANLGPYSERDRSSGEHGELRGGLVSLRAAVELGRLLFVEGMRVGRRPVPRPARLCADRA